MVIIASGCINGNSQQLEEIRLETKEIETEKTGDEILNQTIEKNEYIESHKLTNNNELAMDLSVLEFGIGTETNASFDYTKQTSQGNTNGFFRAGIPLIGSNQTNFETETYSDEETTYVKKKNDTIEKPEWRDMNQSFDKNPLTLDLKLFEGTESNLEGQKTIKGQETYVISVIQDYNKLENHFSSIMNIYAYEETEETEEAEELPEEDIRQIQTYLFIGQEDYKPLKYIYYIDFDIKDNENEGILSFDGRGQIKSETRYFDYNEIQEIEKNDDLT